MTFDAHSNLARSALVNSPGTLGLSFVLETGLGANFSDPSLGKAVVLLVHAANVVPTIANSEIIIATSKLTDEFDVVERGQRGTTAKDVQAGWIIEEVASAETFVKIESRLAVISPGYPTGDAATDTDNLADCFTALAALDPDEPKVLYLPQGIFLINATRSFDIDNLEITGPGIIKVADATASAYVLNSSGSNVKIRGVKFLGNKASAGSSGSTTGIHWASGSAGCYAEFCSFYSFFGAPIRANENNSGSCDRIHTLDCYFEDNEWWAVYYEGSCPNSHVIGNFIREGFGIKLSLGCSRSIIMMNDTKAILGIAYELWHDGDRSLVSFNVAQDCQDGSAPALIGGALQGMGVSIALSDYCIVSHNDLVDLGWAGVENADSSYLKVLHNTIDGVSYLTDGGGIAISTQGTPCNHCIYQGNHLFNCAFKAIHLWGGHSYSKVLENYILNCEAGIFFRDSGSAQTHCEVIRNWVHSCVKEGLEIEANNTEVLVERNDFRGNNTGASTANVVDAGTRTIFNGNRGTHLGNEIVIPARDFSADATLSPTPGFGAKGGTDNQRIQAWGFDENEERYIATQRSVGRWNGYDIPIWWSGKTIQILPDWAPESNGAAGDLVRWLCQMCAVSEGDEIDEAHSATADSNPGVTGQINQDIRTLSGPMTLTMPTLAAYDFVKIRIGRVAPESNSLAADANLVNLILRPVDP